MKHETGNKEYGYTLIEVLIASAIFFILVAGPTGLFISALRSQTRILAQREIIDNTSHAIEYMSRALRMAKKELNCTDKLNPTTCSCLKNNGYGFNYEEVNSRILGGTTYNGLGIKFNNYESPSVCQEFFWDQSDNRIKESKNGGTPNALTSDDIEVIRFKINPGGWDQSDNKQPRVTLLLEMEVKAQRPEGRSKLKIQTTISQRNLDIVY